MKDPPQNSCHLRSRPPHFGSAWESVRGAMDASARSVRPLSAGERESITERVLEIATARGGETIAQLSRRTGNAWTAEETAVANGVAVDHRFASGFPVKIAKDRPYSGS